MAFSTSGSATVNISGQVTSTQSKYTVTRLSGTQSGVNDTVVYTVPAGKKATFVGIHLQGYCNAASSQSANIYRNTSAESFAYIVTETVGAQNCFNSTYGYAEAPQLTAGQTIKVKTTGNMLCSYVIMYIEEDA